MATSEIWKTWCIVHLQKKPWCTTAEVQAALQKPSPEREWSSQPGKPVGGVLGRDTWRQRRWSSLQKQDRMVPARSQKGADVLAKPVARNLAWWEAGRSLCSGKAGSLLPQRSGWGKDPLLSLSCRPTVTQDRVLNPRSPLGQALPRATTPGKTIKSFIYWQRAECLLNVIMKLLSFT